jgi:hypothetical protein
VLPLLVYNVENEWATFVGNIAATPAISRAKPTSSWRTAKGDGLFGWMFDEQWQTPAPHPPSGVIQRTSAEISSLFGHPRRHLPFYAFLLALAAHSPGPRRRAPRHIFRPDRHGSGMGADGHQCQYRRQRPPHHPFVAVSPDGGSGLLRRRLAPPGARRPAGGGGGTTAMFASGVLVTNEYYYVSYSFGGAPAWSDAICRFPTS